MRDAVGAADRLEARVAEEIRDALAAAPAPTGDVYVGSAAAADAAACPARFRAGGEDGWGFPGWSPTNAAAAIGRSALDRHLVEGGRRAEDGDAPPPLELVRAWMRAEGTAGGRSVAGWVSELRADRQGPALAAAAAAATRWLAGFVRVMGWPLPLGLALLNVTGGDGGAGRGAGAPKWWPAKGSVVTVACTADARLGRVTGAGGHVLVVHRPVAADDHDLHGRAAFEAAAGALAYRVAAGAVLVTAGDTGERARVEVDEDLLAAGGALIAAVVRQRVVALTRGFDPADATPSVRCRWCERQASCPPGTAWIDAHRRWRGGLPVHAAG